jgi:hypothetical protein
MKICHGRAISFMGCLTPIYTIYGLLYTTFSLGVHHTNQAGQMAVLLGALIEIYANFTYYHNINTVFLKTRPWDALSR